MNSNLLSASNNFIYNLGDPRNAVEFSLISLSITSFNYLDDMRITKAFLGAMLHYSAFASSLAGQVVAQRYRVIGLAVEIDCETVKLSFLGKIKRPSVF